jgi:hypothetical protein
MVEPRTRRTPSRESMHQGSTVYGQLLTLALPSLPKVGARCVNCARRDLCGGCAVMRIPTAMQPSSQPSVRVTPSRPRLLEETKVGFQQFSVRCPKDGSLPFSDSRDVCFSITNRYGSQSGRRTAV